MKSEISNEPGDPFEAFSPETASLLRVLPDTPNSLALKAYYLRTANQLKRGLGNAVLF